MSANMDIVNKKTNDDIDIINNSAEESEIRKYFAGKTVLVTGSTGFMGKCLVEKLLRGCPELKKLYVLVRPKKALSAEDRTKKFLDDMLFNTVRERYPDCLSKIQLVGGDLTQENMALSEKDKTALINEVNIIFHNASNVKFTERMGTALKINVLGTKAMLDLAKQCNRLEAFLYVSTAYSHAYDKVITEDAYPSPADMKTVKDLIAADLASPTGLSDAALSDVLGKFPNTYSFTKAIAEGMVNDAGKQVSFPCIIYRPTIVLGTWKEPISGWSANLNGPAMLFIGWGLGVIHAAYKGDCRLDFIPVDMSINSMLVVMWHSVKYRSNERPLVYNYGSSNYQPSSLRHFETIIPMTPDGIIHCASNYQIWHPFVIYTDNAFFFAILFVLLHVIPAIFADLYLLYKGKKPRALSMCKKAALSWKLLTHFVVGNFTINTAEMIKIIDRMSPVDRKLFFCDVRELDWHDFGRVYSTGLRVYTLNDPPSTLPAAKRKARLLKKIHYTLKYTFILLIVYLIASKLGLF